MNFFNFVTLIGGVAFFLFGMSVMSSSLEKVSGGKLGKMLNTANASRGRSFMLGAGFTVALQSSSAVTVLLVGLVNSGLMTLRQTIGVIMGSNVGTTLTAWITSLAGLDSEGNFLLQLVNPENFSPLFAVLGAVLLMFSRKQKVKNAGGIICGFAVLMYGMVMMSNAVAPLKASPEFASILTAFKNPFLGLLAGTVVTGIIQSSAASVGILQAFAGGGGLTYGAAIPIIMGQNIGTCVTALISSIGVSKPAKRVAVVHIMFNVVGTAIYFVIIYGLNLIFNFTFLDNPISPLAIAIFHSIFNITVTAILFPFASLLEKLALLMVRDKQKDGTATLLLDERLLNSPSLALTSCHDIILNMCDSAKTAVTEALSLVGKYVEAKAVAVREQEGILDLCEDKLGTYLVKLSARDLTISDSSQAAKFLRAIGDLERIGDHALNILQSAEELNNKKISFSQAAVADFERLTAALDEIIVMTTDAFRENNESTAKQVEPLEQVIDLLVRNARDNHILRMQRGECGIEQGFVWNDILVNMERISDHCSNLALTVITLPDGAFSSHDYMRETRVESNTEFYYAFEHYRQKYGL